MADRRIQSTLPSSNLSSNFAKDLDEDTKDVFIQTSKAQVILIQLIYDPKLSSQAGCWAKINKKKFNSNQCKIWYFQRKKKKKNQWSQGTSPGWVDGAGLAKFHWK